jgi:hypothetical protein
MLAAFSADEVAIGVPGSQWSVVSGQKPGINDEEHAS